MVQIAEEPAPARVGRLHFEHPVQLGGVTDDFMCLERVVMRIGDDDNFFIGGSEGWGIHQLEAVPT